MVELAGVTVAVEAKESLSVVESQRIFYLMHFADYFRY
jgi:hypothetical protein